MPMTALTMPLQVRRTPARTFKKSLMSLKVTSFWTILRPKKSMRRSSTNRWRTSCPLRRFRTSLRVLSSSRLSTSSPRLAKLAVWSLTLPATTTPSIASWTEFSQIQSKTLPRLCKEMNPHRLTPATATKCNSARVYKARRSVKSQKTN